MSGLVERLTQRICSRHGISTLIVAVVLTDAFRASSVAIGVLLLGSLAGAALIVAVAANMWEAKTAPGTPTWAKPRNVSGAPQLREDGNAALWADRGGFLFARRHWFVGTGAPPTRLADTGYRQIVEHSSTEPIRIAQSGNRSWWIYDGSFYWESYGYPPRDIAALIRQRIRRREQQLNHARMMYDAESAPQANGRAVVTREMRQFVFGRDGGRCTQCGSTFDLQYDHVIPVALGGATTVENLQLLCSPCNQSKGPRI